jgi:DNA-binding winged helix-turn-helix (wHTH) protein
VLSFPPFRLDLDNERLWKDGAELRLRRKPFALLRHFVQHPQKLVTHEEIVEAVWGKVATSESLLRTHLSDLRDALGEGVVETITGRGYRFMPEVRQLKLAASRGDATVDGRVFVGRDNELDSLRAALRSTRDRKRVTVFVTGEAGTGKTTLVDLFLEQAGRRNRLGLFRRGQGTGRERGWRGVPQIPPLSE